MSTNFKMYIHSNSDSFHLNLRGDFDGSSAFELINIMKKHCGKVEKIYIHTHGLSSIHPFGLDVFQNNFSDLDKKHTNIFFTGEFGEKIAPGISNLLQLYLRGSTYI